MKRIIVGLLAVLTFGAAAPAFAGSCNAYGCFPTGGGCNAYGCWSSCNGSCNAYGCSENGVCNAYCCSENGACNAYGCP